MDSVNYAAELDQLMLVKRYGLQGVTISKGQFIVRPLWERTARIIVAALNCFGSKENKDSTLHLIQKKVEYVNTVHTAMQETSLHFKEYFLSANKIAEWNQSVIASPALKHKSDVLKIHDVSSIPQTTPELPKSDFTCSFINGDKTPLVISPAINMTREEFLKKIEQHREALKLLVSKYGAILFRGVPGQSKDNFVEIITKTLCCKLADFVGGDGSRKEVAEKVYTSTEAPPQYKIVLHNERSAATINPPPHICFFCEIAPTPGTGQTLLGSSRKITETMQLNPALWNLFHGKTALYRNCFAPKNHWITKINVTHKTWEESFKTNKKKEVEEMCRKKGFSFKWHGEWLEVSYETPCTRPDPDDPSKSYYFNQVHLQYPARELRGSWFNHIAANILYCMPHMRQYDVRLRQGPELKSHDISRVYDVLKKNEIYFSWQKNDVLIVDNMRTTHGRNPYKGARRILVSLVSNEPL